jgi:hypothetical protein
LKPLNDYKRAIALRSALYLLAGIGTIIPAASAIGFSAWGGGTIGAPVSLLGSATLILASIVQMMGVQFVGQRTKEAALLALGGSLAVWSFYLPADVSLTRIWLSDQRLELTVVQWKEFGSSLSVERQGPEFQLSNEEFQEMQAAGIKGKVSVCMARAEYGKGKRSSVLILIQSAVSRPITLKEPDASNIVYFQTGGEWKKYPKDAPTLNRAIDLSPSQSDSLETQVFVELVTGARIGFGVWPPKSEVRSPK